MCQSTTHPLALCLWWARGPCLPAGIPPVPAALWCFTTRFEMGRGGSTTLNARLWFNREGRLLALANLQNCLCLHRACFARPVLVPAQGSPRPCARTTSTSRPASSVRRSSRSSSGGLTCLKQRGWRLRAWFPLRCCQRFSLPTIASEPAGRPTTPPPAGRPRRSSRTKRSSRHHPNRS